MTLDFRQIYFEDDQLQQLYPFAVPHENKGDPGLYFENRVISNIVPTITADLIGICSHRLREKRNESSTPIILLKANNTIDLTEERILSTPFDVAVLTPRNPGHKVLSMSRNWHAPAWDVAFPVFKKFLRSDLNIKVPDELSTAIYENHFIARRDIYHAYVNECLIPSIAHMDCDPVYSLDSGYANRIGEVKARAYRMKTGRNDYPISTFILERLFSIWCEGKGFNIVPL